MGLVCRCSGAVGYVETGMGEEGGGDRKAQREHCGRRGVERGTKIRRQVKRKSPRQKVEAHCGNA